MLFILCFVKCVMCVCVCVCVCVCDVCVCVCDVCVCVCDMSTTIKFCVYFVYYGCAPVCISTDVVI